MSGQNANGEGSVYQRKDGRWVAAAYLRAATGGRRRVSVYGKTRQEAKAKFRELLDKAERNVPAMPARLTVGPYLAEWLTHVRQHVRPNTYVAYEINVRRHIVPRIGKRSLAKLTARDVRIMVDGMRADGVGPGSYNTSTPPCGPRSNTPTGRRSFPGTWPSLSEPSGRFRRSRGSR